MNELRESFKEMYDNLVLDGVYKGLMNTDKRFVFITHSLEKEDGKYEKDNKLFRFNFKFNVNYSFKNESFNFDPMTCVIDLLPIREKMKEFNIKWFSDIDDLKQFIYSRIVNGNKYE
jgi:hypothetical protein